MCRARVGAQLNQRALSGDRLAGRRRIRRELWLVARVGETSVLACGGRFYLASYVF
jgi:hypothetical protein